MEESIYLSIYLYIYPSNSEGYGIYRVFFLVKLMKTTFRNFIKKNTLLICNLQTKYILVYNSKIPFRYF